MAYKKRGASDISAAAKNRIEGVQQFEPTFDFGNGLTNEILNAKILAIDKGIREYNGLLTSADGVSTQIDLDEKETASLSSRLLSAVGAKYGYDSIEYEKAGGVRASDIKRGRGGSSSSGTTK